jgi:site-specific recombinase XerD
VDVEQGRMFIQRLKGSLSQTYPLQADELKLLKRYLRTRSDRNPLLFPSKRGTPIDRTTLHKLMQKYAKVANLPPEKRHFHCLKHSIATHLIDAQADLLFVKDWLGHKNIQNTTAYTQLTNPTREEQARRIFASPRIV